MSTSSSERLWDRWLHWARERPDAEAVVHWRAVEPPVRWTWRALVDEALGFAHALRLAGVSAGDACAIIVRHHPRFHALYLGVSALGAIPSVLAYPNARLHPDKFVHGLSGMARRSGLDFILTERELATTVAPLTSGEGVSIRGVLFPLESPRLPGVADLPTPPGSPGDVCLLQHSSGTTGLQKAVALSHQAVLEHVASYASAIDLRQTDRVVSWLPLYHDMGMIAAFHLPLASGIPVVQLDPFEWVAVPHILLEAIHHERAIVCWLPNFAYNLLADRVHEDDLGDVRLDSMRLFVNCSEPVRADSHARFARRFQARGLSPSSLSACYAMAETTFAATQTEPGEGARVLEVDRDALSRGRVEPAREGQPVRACVSSGKPIPGCSVEVLAEDGAAAAPGQVGELVIRSCTMFEGYRNAPDETRAALRDGRYFSGDLGFVDGGEVFVIGRKKDLIIVAGKNLYPEDIEDAVSQVQGVIPGRAVAIGVDDDAAGTEQIAVIAETAVAGERERGQLRLAIQRSAMAIDVTVARVHLAPPRWLIKSSSGKPSRGANRRRLLAGELPEDPP